MKYKKILFPTDLSPASQEALQYAASLARDSNALLIILHVEESPLAYADVEIYFAQPYYPNPKIRSMLEAVIPPGEGVRHEHRLVMGVAGDEIVRLAAEEGVDLIVMSSHGRTGLGRVLMGSVAETVMRQASCPVLILKTGARVAQAAASLGVSGRKD
jgi:nucleotide-binding universal stress UspA family protein